MSWLPRWISNPNVYVLAGILCLWALSVFSPGDFSPSLFSSTENSAGDSRRKTSPLLSDAIRDLKGLHFREYSGNRLMWELWAWRGNVQRQRYLFGKLSPQRVLRLLRTRAVLYTRKGSLDIHSRRAYYNPLKENWIFVQGTVLQGGKRRGFEQLLWFPLERRVEMVKKRPLTPLFRFWEPRY